MKRLLILALLPIVVTNAQSNITLPSFPLHTTNWTWPVGTSYVEGADTFVITRAVGGQSGYAFYNYLADLTSATASFTVDFNFRIDSGAGPSDTSDGISFFFLRPGYSYSNTTGQDLGIPNNDTGLVILFDTHDNDGNRNNPLVSMQYLNGIGYNEGSPTGLLTPDIGNQYFICDERWHHCTINYSAGIITIAFDGSPPLMTVNHPLSYKGSFGFSGSTGGGYSNQAISDVVITAPIGDTTTGSPPIGDTTGNPPIEPCVVSLGNDAIICIGDSVVLSSPISSGYFYLWNTGSTDSSITVYNAANYVLTVTKDSVKCSDTIIVTQQIPPTLKLGSDTIVCEGDVYTLGYAGTAPITWSNGKTSTNIAVTTSDVYWAIISNRCGTATDSVNISFIHCDLFFPSAFTPNNDGKNDIARVLGNFSLYTDFSLSIYNRFGQCVFYTEDINDGWYGKYNNVDAAIDAYFYFISYTVEGKQRMVKGDLTLIR